MGVYKILNYSLDAISNRINRLERVLIVAVPCNGKRNNKRAPPLHLTNIIVYHKIRFN